jgi:hypothetical protein
MSPVWDIPVAFFAGIVTVEHIARSYRGGTAAFDRDFPDARRNATLRAVSRMSCGDLESIVEQWEANGLRLGESIAIGDMMHGEIVACPGVRFRNAGEEFRPQWYVE